MTNVLYLILLHYGFCWATYARSFNHSIVCQVTTTTYLFYILYNIYLFKKYTRIDGNIYGIHWKVISKNSNNRRCIMLNKCTLSDIIYFLVFSDKK